MEGRCRALREVEQEEQDDRDGYRWYCATFADYGRERYSEEYNQSLLQWLHWVREKERYMWRLILNLGYRPPLADEYSTNVKTVAYWRERLCGILQHLQGHRWDAFVEEFLEDLE